MSKEIERKFLVHGKPWEAYEDCTHIKIAQGYLSRTDINTIRIRIMPVGACITLKSPRIGNTCYEFEYYIPSADAIHILNTMSDGKLVEKVRHTFVDEHKQRWEIDEFAGINEGLFMAEIELESEETKVILPSWIAKEVSGDFRYTNSYLADHKVVDN